MLKLFTRICPRGSAAWAPGLLLCLSVACGPAGSAEGELDIDLMQTIEDLNKSLSSNIALRDVKASSSDARELQPLFAQVEAHFSAKGDALDAVELAKKSKELSAAIIKQVGASQFDAATDSATAISRACRSCHTFYKKS
ncbi:hypothetical protein LNV08_20095 [Paucibacter sp. TC2R-5]|uniref:hypothetical protein n=1 Tax=Paucibacter sp. TC2R-5 TaxID=2893555 RepID=UPI0021E4AB99|nr:hypothetical protein [Paucibacter sp. TC2R-5]MCV2361273.1 hypothetical protein [Paucibacter sp. TC2R-5]